MIHSSIIEHFRELDSIVESCNALKEAKKEYLQSLKELNLDIDTIEKNRQQYEQKAQEKEERLKSIQKEIGDYFCNGYNTLEPLTIGIFGEWGSGKTHILQGVKQQIRQSNNINSNITIIPILFNAWRFEKEEHIIIPLFQTIVAELDNYSYQTGIKNLQQKLKFLSFALRVALQFSSGIDFAGMLSSNIESIKGVGKFFNIKEIAKNLNFSSDDLEKLSEKEQEKKLKKLLNSGHIESIYLKIPQWIEKITIFDNVRFVFLIDDLDRCLPENTLKMLESIKLFLDVAGCSFVLAIDDDVIERGVEHHYKDYIQRNSNHTYINCNQKEQNTTKENSDTKNNTTTQSNSTTNSNYNQETDKKRVLPITGNEYLEKIVQLPFRIPPIDNLDVKEFLQSRYPRFQNLENQTINNIEKTTKTNPNIELLEFFAKTIPPKPRKIIRTITLFEAKEKLSSRLININHILLAKLTLLELFAPKLFRFMQSKGFVRLYKRLVKWQEEHNTLSQFNAIKQDILNSNLPDIDRFLFLELQEIIESLYKSRVEFNLDNIFNEDIDETTLKEHLFFKNYKIAIKEPQKQKETQPQDIELFFKRLLSNDTLLWRDAFSEDSNLKDINAILDNQTFNTLLEKLKNKQELVNTPGWLELVAEHLSNTQLLKLIKTYNPFKDIS